MTTNTDIQRAAWRELLEMLSDSTGQNCEIFDTTDDLLDSSLASESAVINAVG